MDTVLFIALITIALLLALIIRRLNYICEFIEWYVSRLKKRDGRLIPASPTELLEIHRTHLHALLFARYEDARGVLANRNERAGLDIVVAPILDEHLYRLSGKRAQLDLVEDDKRLALVKLLLVSQLKLQEKTVVERPLLSEEDLKQLDQRIHRLKPGMLVQVIYHEQNECIQIQGILSKISMDTRFLQIVKTKIPFRSILSIQGEELEDDPFFIP